MRLLGRNVYETVRHRFAERRGLATERQSRSRLVGAAHGDAKHGRAPPGLLGVAGAGAKRWQLTWAKSGSGVASSGTTPTVARVPRPRPSWRSSDTRPSSF